MLDPGNDLLPPPSSPTNSSISSSDLDTESTGSFFHDRSTTLGTLMGVTFPAVVFRAPSQRRRETPITSAAAAIARSSCRGRRREAERRRRWWSLCCDGDGDGGARPSSLEEFLEVERRCGDVGGGRALFADGRVLPPATVDVHETASSALCRFPLLLTGICSGCVR